MKSVSLAVKTSISLLLTVYNPYPLIYISAYPAIEPPYQKRAQNTFYLFTFNLLPPAVGALDGLAAI